MGYFWDKRPAAPMRNHHVA